MSSDKIVIVCQSCGTVVRVPASAAGKMGRCPKCQTAIQAPAYVPDDAPIDLNEIMAPPVIAMSDPPLERTLFVIESDLESQGIYALIGLDILADCTFVFDGPSGRFSLSW